jgi:hypothetical protein
VRGEAGWASRKRHASRAEEMCGGGMSVDRSTVEREMQGERAVFFWLSHVSSVGYPKADESCCSFIGF